MCDVSKIIEDAEKLADTTEKSVGIIEKLLNTNPDYRAKMLYMKEIENDPTLTKIEKMEALFAYGTIKKQMKNIASTYTLADIKLKEKGKSIEEEFPKLDVDWVNYYNDVVKNFSNEEMQAIWARILAEECEEPGSISKRLINILQLLDKASAKAFSYMCLHSFLLTANNGESEYAFIYPEWSHVNMKMCDCYDTSIIGDETIRDLESLGLINFNALGFLIEKNEVKIDYYGELIKIVSNSRQISIGRVTYTRAGEELIKILKIILDRPSNLVFMESICQFFENVGCKVIK